jgi:hypothetical protein
MSGANDSKITARPDQDGQILVIDQKLIKQEMGPSEADQKYFHDPQLEGCQEVSSRKTQFTY